MLIDVYRSITSVHMCMTLLITYLPYLSSVVVWRQGLSGCDGSKGEEGGRW